MHGVVARAGDKHPAVGGEREVVGAQADGDIANATVGLGVDDADRAAAPIRDIEVPLVGAELAGVRMLSHGDHVLAGERLGVEHEDLVIALVADVDLAVLRMHGDPGEEDRAAVWRGDRDGGCRRGLAVGIVEHVKLGGVASRDEDPAVVAIERDAVPAFLQREKLRDCVGLEADEGQAGVAVTGAHGDERLLVGGDDHLERHVAHMDMLSRRRDTPSRMKQGIARQHARAGAHGGVIEIFVGQAGWRRGALSPADGEGCQCSSQQQERRERAE